MSVRERPETSAAVLERMHAALLERGWFIASARALGLPDEAGVIEAFSSSLAADPRGAGKLHARDVVRYSRGCCGPLPCVSGVTSIAHVDGTDDYSRFEVIEDDRTIAVPGIIADLVPPSLRRPRGRMSADYFRYSPGTESPAHQDKFGDLVVIWVLDRNGDGAESFLTTLDGRDVMRGPIGAGQLLVFRDEMFLHGVTELKSGHRDALIFITLKDGA